MISQALMPLAPAPALDSSMRPGNHESLLNQSRVTLLFGAGGRLIGY